MARLPDSLPQDSVQGPGLPIQGLPPTDFGLGQAGDIAQAVAVSDRRARFAEQRAQDKADQDAVRPDVLKLINANADQLANDASQWNGQAGFAADQVKAYTARAADSANNPAYTPGQRAAFRRLADQATESAGMAAITHEAQRISQDAVQAKEVQANGVVAGFIQDYGAAKQSLVDGYDGSQPTFAKDALAAFDQHAAAAIQAAPETLQPQLQAQFSRMRVQEAADALGQQTKAHEAFVLGSADRQANGLIDSIVSNPSAYASVLRDGLPPILATIPAEHRDEAARTLGASAATARIKGLIEHDQFGQAAAELNDGRYDQVLKPEAKEALLAQTSAENRAHGPEAITRALEGITLEGRMQADIYARLTGGRGTGLDLGDIAGAVAQGLVSPSAAASWIAQGKAADQTFAAVGPIHQMPTGQVAGMASAAPPDPASPGYATNLPIWQAQVQAAQAELKSRQDPGAWTWSAGAKVTGKGVAGAAAGQDRGAMLQGLWAQVLQNGQGAGRYAGLMLGYQKASGIAPSSYQIVPQSEAARLAAAVVNAPPEGRLGALQTLAGLIHSLPPAFRMPDGSTATPRALLGKQLLAAHLSPMELSAVLDYGSDPAKLGRLVAATNDPTLRKDIAPAQSRAIEAAVRAQMAPFLSSSAPLPGEEQLAQARLDRTVLVAKSLMQSQHLTPQAAAKTAAQDVAAGYRFVDTWRMPADLASQTSVDTGGIHSGASLARSGAAAMMLGLTQDGGQHLYAPNGGAGGDQQRALYAAQVAHNGRWVTLPDDSGLTLMAPHPDGTWDQVADRYGRPVRAGWSELQAIGKGQAKPAYMAPPPNQPTANGKPVPAASRSAAFGAVSWAVTGAESRFHDGLVSPAGALGRMQVMPDTVKAYAPRLGLPVDLERARTDAGYNQKIGEAALADHINHFGPSGAGLALAIAAYNAGPGRLDGYTDARGHHPGWLQTIGDPRTGRISLDDFVARIPIKETRDYVKAVLPAAYGRLQGHG